MEGPATASGLVVLALVLVVGEVEYFAPEERFLAVSLHGLLRQLTD